MSIFKKIFKFGKKVVKGVGHAFDNKWVRMAGLAALTVFVTGLSSDGFGGFNTAMETGGGGLHGFFSAVGSTMATGFTTIKGGIAGMFAGTGTTAPSRGMLAQGMPDFSSSPQWGASLEAGKGLASKITGSIFNADSGSTGSLIRSMMIAGLTYGASGNRGGGGTGYPGQIRARSTFYGDRARKSGNPNLPEGFIRKPIAQTSNIGQGQPAQEPGAPRTAGTTQASPTLQAPLLGRATQIASLPAIQDQRLLG